MANTIEPVDFGFFKMIVKEDTSTLYFDNMQIPTTIVYTEFDLAEIFKDSGYNKYLLCSDGPHYNIAERVYGFKQGESNLSLEHGHIEFTAIRSNFISNINMFRLMKSKHHQIVKTVFQKILQPYIDDGSRYILYVVEKSKQQINAYSAEPEFKVFYDVFQSKSPFADEHLPTYPRYIERKRQILRGLSAIAKEE